MGTLIDSSVFVAVERGRLDLRAAMDRPDTEAVAISAITASELLHGVHRAQEHSQRQRRESFVEGILSSIRIVHFDLAAARVHARLAAELARIGSPIGAHDLLIGATAVLLDYQVATRDLRSLPRIAGLRVARW